jgi:hypothetical protein
MIDAQQLRAVEDEAIRHVVEQQCACGLQVVTDGEFRRAWWHFDFFDGLQGVERYDSNQGIQFNGVQTKAHGVRVTGKLGFGSHPMLDDFRYLQSVSGTAQPKMTIPSPSVLHFRGGRKDIDATVYPDLDVYFDDLAQTWRDAIHAFYNAGCRNLQLDHTVWAYLCSDDQRRQIRCWHLGFRALVCVGLFDVNERSCADREGIDGSTCTDREHIVILSAFDDHHHRFAIGRSVGGLGETLTALPRQHRQRSANAFDPLWIRNERHEIGFQEIAIIVRVLFRSQGVRSTIGLVPMPRLLADHLSVFEKGDLTADLVFDRSAE